ncbi:MAG TPA: YraN family protein [Bacillota bacterium]|nr:YraN family protein [Bacillota bacterium]
MTLGSWGEAAAEKYLKKKGYAILERNFRCRLGEIDIIALDGRSLVFIEVKTRCNQNYGLPCEAVTAAKLQHLKRTAAYYIAAHNAGSWDLRLDVIEILARGSRAYIHHMEGV